MAVQMQPGPAPAALRRPELRVIEARPRRAQLHLVTFVVVNALFWALWAAISVTAERWYWWPIIPLAGWAVVLAGHLWRMRPDDERKEVSSMPTELLTDGNRTASAPAASAADDELYAWARGHAERVRRLKFHIAAFVLGMLVLTPIWLLVEWQDNGSFERWSANSNPGDWEPWILYVALAWGTFVAVTALKVHFDRPTTQAEIDRELRRLRAH